MFAQPEPPAELRLPESPVPLPAPVIDSHTHLTSTTAFSGLSVADSLALAASVGVTRVVEIGCDLDDSRQAVEIAEQYPQVIASVAIHPNDAARLAASKGRDALQTAIAGIEALARRPGVRGVGETGLDTIRTTSDEGRRIQRESFEAHIDIAKRLGRTLVIHDREAHRPILETLDAVGAPERVVMHCFSGDRGFAEECLARGFWLSFPGVVTFKNAKPQAEAARVTPAEKLLVETDAPYLTPVPFRGRPNAPYLLPHTVRFLADLRDEDPAALCQAITAATFAAFGGAWPVVRDIADSGHILPRDIAAGGDGGRARQTAAQGDDAATGGVG